MDPDPKSTQVTSTPAYPAPTPPILPANTAIPENTTTPIKKSVSKHLILILLIIFPPLAWYYMWKEDKYHNWFASVLIIDGLIFIATSIMLFAAVYPPIVQLYTTLLLPQPIFYELVPYTFIALGIIEVIYGLLLRLRANHNHILSKKLLFFAVLLLTIHFIGLPLSQIASYYSVFTSVYSLNIYDYNTRKSTQITPQPQPTISPISTSNWKTYTNKEFSFSIDVPFDTEINEKIIKPESIESPTCLVVFRRTIGRPLNEGLFEIPICYFDNPNKLSLAEFDDSHSRPTDVDGITTPRLESPENKDVILTSGTKAYYQKNHYCVARCPRYIIVREDKIFTLTARNLKVNDEESFDKILSTFTFLDKTSPSPTIPTNNKPVACTMDAKLCPDGSSVGRSGPNCEFSPCP